MYLQLKKKHMLKIKQLNSLKLFYFITMKLNDALEHYVNFVAWLYKIENHMIVRYIIYEEAEV